MSGSCPDSTGHSSVRNEEVHVRADQLANLGPAGQALINRLESWRGFAKFPVKGGVGLLGGKLPAIFYTPAVYPDTVPTIPTTEPLGLDLKPISISFPWDDSKPTPSKQDAILSEGQFSGWLSNRANLELRP